ncbi:MAG: hypothetical protein JXR13_18660 [Thalassovita sp.]
MAVINDNRDGKHGVHGTEHDDTITTTANGTGQIHVWGKKGDDTINLNFAEHGTGDALEASSPRQWWFGGHHVYGGEGVVGGSDGTDILNFTNVHNVNGLTVGRIEDFNAANDEIQIEGVPINLAAGYGTAGNYSWKIVQWDTNPDDSASGTQPWLVIDTNGGVIFYALEGARVVPHGEGASNNFEQERHFIHFDHLPTDQNGNATEQAILDLPAEPYIDPINFVPVASDGSPLYVPDDGGKLVNDYDNTYAQSHEEEILGTDVGDVIAAGVNDDVVHADGGDDTVWGGSGHDVVYGGNGGDRIWGGTGNDLLDGGDHTDFLYGGHGADTLHGGEGDDILDGGIGNDYVLAGSGNDTLTGGEGADHLIGQSGDDVLSGGSLGDTLWGGEGNDFLNGGFGYDQLVGGSGADTFYHENNVNHATDWIQDYDQSEGDVLQFNGYADEEDFVFAIADSGSGNTASDQDELFISLSHPGFAAIPVLWALVDGEGSGVTIKTTGATYEFSVDEILLAMNNQEPADFL